MSEFYVTIANGVLQQDFLTTQEQERQEYVFSTDEAMLCFINNQMTAEYVFCLNTRLEFLSNVTTYFSQEHNISQEDLELRYKEVSIDRFNLRIVS